MPVSNSLETGFISFPSNSLIKHPSIFEILLTQISEETLRELFPKVLQQKKVWLLMSYHPFGDGNIPVKALMKAFNLMGGKEFYGLQLYEFGPRKIK